MRGLKLFTHTITRSETGSHLLQMRGLKLLLVALSVVQVLVASFTDAWIETNKTYSAHITVKVASFTDAWIETNVMAGIFTTSVVASFTDAWIETI